MGSFFSRWPEGKAPKDVANDSKAVMKLLVVQGCDYVVAFELE